MGLKFVVLQTIILLLRRGSCTTTNAYNHKITTITDSFWHYPPVADPEIWNRRAEGQGAVSPPHIVRK